MRALISSVVDYNGRRWFAAAELGGLICGLDCRGLVAAFRFVIQHVVEELHAGR